MADRFFPNEIPAFIPETPGTVSVSGEPKDSLAKLLQLPYEILSERLKTAALDLKETVLFHSLAIRSRFLVYLCHFLIFFFPGVGIQVMKVTWGLRGKRVSDYTLYTGALGTAFLLFKSYQVTKDKSDLLVCSEIIKACEFEAKGSG